MTSHDAVFRLRKIVGEKKIGHGGTLDPDVTGVLPIAIGKATRLIEYMQEEGKTYEGEITLGFSTTTEDASGELVETTPVYQLSEDEVDHMMASFHGVIKQVPPLYSAVKVNGRKLYEYARANQEVERPERQVEIVSFERTSPIRFEAGCARFDFRVICGKGTYVRTLSVDLGAKLGYASHMSRLERTASAGMHVAEAIRLEEVATAVDKGDWTFLQPIERGLGTLPTVDVTSQQEEEIRFGRFVAIDRTEEVIAALHQGRLIAILERREGIYKPRKVFLS